MNATDLSGLNSNAANHADNPAGYNVETPTITLKNPTRNGYDFEGWFNESNELVTQITLGSSGDISLTAHWSEHTYTITYDLNATDPNGSNSNATNDENNPSTYKFTTPTITLADATRTGYIFTGWKDNATGLAIEEIPQGTYTDFTLIAQWQEEEQNLAGITVTFGIATGDVDVTPEDTGTTVKYTLNTAGGFTSYYWEFDGTAQASTTNILTLDKSSLQIGVYDVYLEAVKDGITYSWSQQITITE